MQIQTTTHMGRQSKMLELDQQTISQVHLPIAIPWLGRLEEK